MVIKDDRPERQLVVDDDRPDERPAQIGNQVSHSRRRWGSHFNVTEDNQQDHGHTQAGNRGEEMLTGNGTLSKPPLTIGSHGPTCSQHGFPDDGRKLQEIVHHDGSRMTSATVRYWLNE